MLGIGVAALLRFAKIALGALHVLKLTPSDEAELEQ